MQEYARLDEAITREGEALMDDSSWALTVRCCGHRGDVNTFKGVTQQQLFKIYSFEAARADVKASVRVMQVLRLVLRSLTLADDPSGLEALAEVLIRLENEDSTAEPEPEPKQQQGDPDCPRCAEMGTMCGICINAQSSHSDAAAPGSGLGEAPAAATGAEVEPEPEPSSEPAAGADADADAGAAALELQPDDLSSALRGAHLSQYEDALRELGCINFEDLKDLDAEDMMEIGMKKIEIRRLQRYCPPTPPTGIGISRPASPGISRKPYPLVGAE